MTIESHLLIAAAIAVGLEVFVGLVGGHWLFCAECGGRRGADAE